MVENTAPPKNAISAPSSVTRRPRKTARQPVTSDATAFVVKHIALDAIKRLGIARFRDRQDEILAGSGEGSTIIAIRVGGRHVVGLRYLNLKSIDAASISSSSRINTVSDVYFDDNLTTLSSYDSNISGNYSEKISTDSKYRYVLNESIAAELKLAVQRDVLNDSKELIGSLLEGAIRHVGVDKVDFRRPIVLTPAGRRVLADVPVVGTSKIDRIDGLVPAKGGPYADSEEGVVVFGGTFSVVFTNGSVVISRSGNEFRPAINQRHAASLARARPELPRWAEENRETQQVKLRLLPAFVEAVDAAAEARGVTRTEYTRLALEALMKSDRSRTPE
jgi:hypothetical protein